MSGEIASCEKLKKYKCHLRHAKGFFKGWYKQSVGAIERELSKRKIRC